jgi:hypothetical protein
MKPETTTLVGDFNDSTPSRKVKITQVMIFALLFNSEQTASIKFTVTQALLEHQKQMRIFDLIIP